MRKSPLHNHNHLISTILAVALLLATSEAVDHHHRHRSWLLISKSIHNKDNLGVMPCGGKLGNKCMVEDDELYGNMVGSEVNSRRILATTQYISYGALTANTVPCSISGASYYNCRPGAEANPYTRACTAITQCRS